ncbi:Uncharacterized protein dnm_094690 [Desulfonema magnum]|uniref:Uncharacterized protein n=1 Tax=Desulfonema magnum TaxID=45655 RepID=A0A975BX68_9BACT|nr:Uncharacterized protein dnm_094690 [Desulfonema magnum]
MVGIFAFSRNSQGSAEMEPLGGIFAFGRNSQGSAEMEFSHLENRKNSA